MRRAWLWLVILSALPLALLPGPAAAQLLGPAGEVSIDSIFSALRLQPDLAFRRALAVQSSLTVQPELWPRTRVDSLAAGIVDLLLQDRHLHMTSVLARILATEASDGRTVGSPEQMVLLAEAAGSRDKLSLFGIHQKMGVFAEEAIVVDWLVDIATSDDAEIPDWDRTSAIEALTESQRGRASLRLMHARDEARGWRARALLKRLAERDFRSGGGREP